jgi:hypothetical protein
MHPVGSYCALTSSAHNSSAVFLSTTNEMQRYTIFFIVVSAPHVLSVFSAHHQELKNCTCSIGYESNFFGGETHPC